MKRSLISQPRKRRAYTSQDPLRRGSSCALRLARSKVMITRQTRGEESDKRQSVTRDARPISHLIGGILWIQNPMRAVHCNLSQNGIDHQMCPEDVTSQLEEEEESVDAGAVLLDDDSPSYHDVSPPMYQRRSPPHRSVSESELTRDARYRVSGKEQRRGTEKERVRQYHIIRNFSVALNQIKSIASTFKSDPLADCCPCSSAKLKCTLHPLVRHLQSCHPPTRLSIPPSHCQHYH
ncbi:sterile alpha motif domain-containing protein 12 isoform X2 [Lates japonicus]|uniref:Sterile alpha motif domain-containing protein 12 isoform X2 n=1 Tax=Lates japonicus TaxID=270547 RepID=A0AAD3RIH1_LATJO|nr:sterile alpha motif domain-containing protein 12 isoform X2 [Lates japonicus]